VVFCVGLAITFIFLALNSACKPFCTEGLSRLSALTLIAQFITLYGGMVLIVEYFIKKERSASNEEDTTSNTISIIYGLVYISNAAVCGWPAIQFLLVSDPVRYMKSALKRFSSSPEIKDDNEKYLDSQSSDIVAEQQAQQQATTVGISSLVHIKEMSNCPSQDEFLQFQEQAYPWLGPAVLSKENVPSLQQTGLSFLDLDSRQSAGQNVLAQV
jgi:hypothetical protein